MIGLPPPLQGGGGDRVCCVVLQILYICCVVILSFVYVKEECYIGKVNSIEVNRKPHFNIKSECNDRSYTLE